MDSQAAFERRLIDALAAYADEGPLDVEALALARELALDHPGRRGLPLRWLPSLALRPSAWLVLAALLVVATIGLLLAAGQRRTAMGPGLVAFAREGDIFLAAADGSRAVLALEADPPLSVRGWSPDGGLLVVHDDEVLYTLDPRTLGLTTVRTPEPWLEAFVGWLADGRVVTMSRDRLYVVDLHSGAARAVGPGEFVCLPVVSPDGRFIAGIIRGPEDSGREGGTLIVIDVASGSWTELAHWSGYGCGPSGGSGWDAPTWSPDSERIAYVEYPEILNIRRDGTDPVVVRPANAGPAYEWPRPQWSPTGEWIAFRTDGGGLWVVRPDGSDAHVLSREFIDRRMLAWTADGSMIDFGRKGGSDDWEARVELWTVEVATGRAERIEAVGADFDSFARQPYLMGELPALPDGSPAAAVAPE